MLAATPVKLLLLSRSLEEYVLAVVGDADDKEMAEMEEVMDEEEDAGDIVDFPALLKLLEIVRIGDGDECLEVWGFLASECAGDIAPFAPIFSLGRESISGVCGALRTSESVVFMDDFEPPKSFATFESVFFLDTLAKLWFEGL